MNFRKLIEKALNEAREEYAEIVARKLRELMGDEERAAPARPHARPKAPTPKGDKTRSRAPANHMAVLREKVIGALRAGEPMKKSQIMKGARLGEEETARVGNVLKKLKDEGMLAMKGEKGAATYTLKG